ncbi:MAG TPA: ABC transporter substrate-binding protein [Kiloniellales bacterium]|nr:ABC transporter substrate-binding protein [Kiloniellales bacterium]
MLRTIKVAVAATAVLLVTSAANAQAPKQGGQMVVTYKDDISTLDPAIGYDWQNWSMIKSLFDGLMDYKPGTTELIPDLAESYSVSNDGLVYTFNLRKGVKFHNGRELTSTDIKYSIERSVNPTTQSPGQGFFWQIKGFDEMTSGASQELSGITTPDPYTVVIELSQPDATFLQIVAINFAFAVPREEVEKYGADFGRNPVGTGAFRMTEWTLGQRVVFERNKDYFREGSPYLDKIIFEVGQDPSVALLRLKRGEVDVLGDPIPSANFLQERNDPANQGLIVKGDLLHTGYITMNVTKPPFDNKLVRQAVNMAINKERVLRIVNNRGVVANQPLPPAMPGYDTSYEGYPYDPAKAKQLLAEAGYPNGFETELYAMNTDPNPRIAQSFQQDLAAIGIKAEIKALAQATVIDAGGQGAAPMLWSGGMAWIADYPDPSNFYGPILGCGGAVPGGWNWAKYCNKEIEALATKADGMARDDQAAERIDLWRQIFVKIMEDAPWAPVFNEVRFAMHSARIGGDDIFFADPIHIPVHYEYVYAKDAK